MATIADDASEMGGEFHLEAVRLQLERTPTALEKDADPAHLQVIRDVYGGRSQTIINTLLAFDGYFKWYYPLKASNVEGHGGILPGAGQDNGARLPQLLLRHRPP